jgi:hypothetical protein
VKWNSVFALGTPFRLPKKSSSFDVKKMKIDEEFAIANVIARSGQ